MPVVRQWQPDKLFTYCTYVYMYLYTHIYVYIMLCTRGHICGYFRHVCVAGGHAGGTAASVAFRLLLLSLLAS